MRILTLLAVALFATPLAAQEETPTSTQPALVAAAEIVPGDEITVATREAPPFAFRGPDGAWTGIAIEMWEALADELDIIYTLEEASLSEMIEGTADGTYGAALAALSITADREQVIDFTFPYYSTGLGIAVAQGAGGLGGWLNVARNLFTWQFLVVVGSLSAVLMIAGVAIWLFERRANEDEFNSGPVQGLGDGFWWAAVTMTTVGYGDKSPRSLGGRIVGLIWMFTAMIIAASFTASIAASLTLGQLDGRVSDVSDLSDVRVGVVAGSAGATELQERWIDATGYDSVEAGYEALLDNDLDAFVHDRPLLRYVARQDYQGKIQVQDKTIGRQDYGIALPEGSDKREALNLAVLAYVRSPNWGDITQRYLGGDD